MVAQFLRAATAPATRRAYQCDLRDFAMWGGSLPCTAATLASYIAERAARHSPATIARRVVAIGRAHAAQGFADPSKNDLVRAVLRGLRRTHCMQQRQAAPLLSEDLLRLLERMHGGKKCARDRALILLGFAAALRRSELVALDVSDLRFVPEGMVVHVRRSKTDQEGEGRKIAVPCGRTTACPVNAVQQWLAIAPIECGAVFRSITKLDVVSSNRLTDQSVSRIVKAHVQTIGLLPESFSGHSLRAGLVTSAARAGVSLHKIQQQTGHKSVVMLSRYVRDAQVFDNNAAAAVL